MEDEEEDEKRSELQRFKTDENMLGEEEEGIEEAEMTKNSILIQPHIKALHEASRTYTGRFKYTF